MKTTPLTLTRKAFVVLVALLGGVAAAVLCAFAGGLLAVAAAAAGFIHGENATWAPLTGAFYGFVAGILVGALVAWKHVAGRFGIARTKLLQIAAAIMVMIPLIEYALLHSPAMVGPPDSAGRINIAAISNDGSFIILSDSRPNSAFLYRFDTKTGHWARLTHATDRFELAAELSPDEKQIVFVSERRPNPSDSSLTLSQVMLCSVDGSNLHPLLPESNTDFAPTFTRDSSLIYFARHHLDENDSRAFEIYSARQDGSDIHQLTHRRFETGKDLYIEYPRSFSHDGKRVLMHAESASGSRMLIYELEDDSRPASVIVPRIPNGSAQPVLGDEMFTPDDSSVIFTAASGEPYAYDLFRMELATQKVEKITDTKHYATDFALSANQQAAAFIVWTGSSLLNAQPLNPSLKIFDMRTRTASTVKLPEIKDRQ